jgi:hypothetical protein
MSSIFGDLERFAADLYPYRWPITIGLIVVCAAAAALVYRMRWHEVLWRHRLISAAIAIPLVAIAVPAGWYTLSPLWERSYLDEANPLAAASTPATPTATASEAEPTGGGSAPSPEPSSAAEPAASVPPTAPTAAPTQPPAAFVPRITHLGEFEGADDFHFGRGDAQIIETAPGAYTLRFEDFSVRNGPDLFVYLSPDNEEIDGAINLGALKATDGSFNYEIPAGTDISAFSSAIVWCRQFATRFASAPLVAQ